jgi:hypothetical protein
MDQLEQIRFENYSNEIGMPNLLRSFFHFQSIPNPIINYIFTLVGKNGFYFFNTKFFISKLKQTIDNNDISIPYKIYLGLDNKLTFPRLVFMDTIHIVDCNDYQCSILMTRYIDNSKSFFSNEYSDYSDDESDISDKFIKLCIGNRINTNTQFLVGELYHCVFCYPNIDFSLNSIFSNLQNKAQDTLFNYYVLGNKNAVEQSNL